MYCCVVVLTSSTLKKYGWENVCVHVYELNIIGYKIPSSSFLFSCGLFSMATVVMETGMGHRK